MATVIDDDDDLCIVGNTHAVAVRPSLSDAVPIALDASPDVNRAPVDISKDEDDIEVVDLAQAAPVAAPRAPARDCCGQPLDASSSAACADADGASLLHVMREVCCACCHRPLSVSDCLAVHGAAATAQWGERAARAAVEALRMPGSPGAMNDAVLALLKDPLALQTAPWAHALWLVDSLSLRDVRNLLRAHGLPLAGAPAECAARLRAASAARPLLHEAALAAATAAVLLRLRLATANALPESAMLGGGAASDAGVAEGMYTAAGVQRALQPAGAPQLAGQKRARGSKDAMPAPPVKRGAGTGYCGDRYSLHAGGRGGGRGRHHGGRHAAASASAAAAKRQAASDRRCADICACLHALLALLQRAARPRSPMGFMHAPLAVMRACGGAAAVRALVEDSVDAMLDALPLHEALMSLLAALATTPALAPLLVCATDAPAWLSPPAAAAASTSAPAPAGESIAAAVERVHGAAAVWRRGGAALLDGAADEAAEARCLGFVLRVGDVAEQIRDAAALHAPPPPQAGAAAAGAGSEEACRAAHEATLRRLCTCEADLAASHAFRAAALDMRVSSAAQHRRHKVISRHVSSLNTLPAHWASSVHVAVDSQRLDLLRVLILPDGDTPYGNGAFLFDALLPASYPDAPPKMTFLTTGGGRVRFNPNLYNCGKVCLSLLGTWSGPSWDAATSTLIQAAQADGVARMQVLVSLQAMVFCAAPYFNEPGFQASEGTPQGRAASDRYNASVRVATAQHAILAPLRRPDGGPHGVFADVLRAHWTAKRGAIKTQLREWGIAKGIQRDVAAALDAL